MELRRPATRRHIQVRGPRAADAVWESYVRPQRWPQWSPQIRAVDYPGETLRPGTGGVVHGPAGLRVRFRVLAVDPTGPVRSWSWAVSVAGLRLVLRHTVESVDAGTRTGLTVDGPAPVVLSYLPVARWALRRLVGRAR
ncbi:SRPBCC family protein [Actinoplanes sp. NPDC020271]|uniref:SRPBCC family protein n=1 Tax=Actinoplanes sp. NPDC020271 TaxID=3363896 RepID=UPI00378ED329